MPDTKISALTAASSLADTDELVVASAGASKKITGANLKASIPGTLPVTIFDAKGDLIVASGPDAGARVPVGTDGQVLQADSAQALGLKWATPAGGAAGALTLLSTTTLASPGTFDVSSISQAYNDLEIVLIGRSASAGTFGVVCDVKLNNDSGANYTSQKLQGASTTASAAELNSQTFFGLLAVPGDGNPAGLFSISMLTIYGYASTVWKKMIEMTNLISYGAGSTNNLTVRATGLWNSSAAVNRIQISSVSGNLLAGSQLRIYGRL